MKRLLQHPFVWIPVLAGMAVIVVTLLPRVEIGLSADTGPRVDKATHQGYKETIPDSMVEFEMVAIPGGTFLMGSPANEPGRADDEGPQHLVQVQPFWMDKCEVTWDMYDLWWRQNPGNKDEQRQAESKNVTGKDYDAITRPTPPYSDETFGHGREGQPVLSITHHAASEFCHWLSDKTKKDYRLPTEAEWEWACRAGSKTAYCFGDDSKPIGDYAWFADNAENVTHLVGAKKPNAWGLHDMHGNVAEWCLDTYKKDAYAAFANDKPALSPVLLPGPDRYGHVVRGGSWSDKPAGLRSAARRSSDKEWIKQDPQQPQSIWWLTDADFVGFRIVRAVKEQDNLKGLRSKIRWESD